MTQEITNADIEFNLLQAELMDVKAQLATVTAERDELKAWKSTVPMTAIRGVFITAWYEGDTDIEVRAWLKAQGERVPE